MIIARTPGTGASLPQRAAGPGPVAPSSSLPTDEVQLSGSAPPELPKIDTAWLDGYQQQVGTDFPNLAKTLARPKAPEEPERLREVVEKAIQAGGLDKTVADLEEFLAYHINRNPLPIRAFQIMQDLVEPVQEKGLPPEQTYKRIPKQIDLGLLTNRASGLGFGDTGYCGILTRAWVEAVAEQSSFDLSPLLPEVKDRGNALAIHNYLYKVEDKQAGLQELADFARSTGTSPASGSLPDRMQLERGREAISSEDPRTGLERLGAALAAAERGSIGKPEVASELLGGWLDHAGLEAAGLKEAVSDGPTALAVFELLKERPEPVETARSLAELTRLMGSERGLEAVELQRSLDERMDRGEPREKALEGLLRERLGQGAEELTGGTITIQHDCVKIGNVTLQKRL